MTTAIGRPLDPATAATGDAYDRATALLAMGVVFAIGLDYPVAAGASATLGLAVVLAPLWLPTLRRVPLATTILVLAGIAVAWGVALSELAAVDHSVSRANQVQSIGLLASGVGAIVLLVWARAHLPLHRIVAAYGAGALAGALSSGQTSWKFDLAVPTIFLLLGVLEGGSRRRLAALAIIVLGVLGALDEGRSLFGLCLLAALMTLWQVPASNRPSRVRRWYPALLMAGASLVIYFLATSLLTGGYLGATLQERSTEQVETTGSLITGGRPEWAATIELASNRPQGFGVGVVPNWNDYMAGKSGLASINVDTGGYAKYYLFGGQFRLHSVAADLWVSYGVVGVGLAVVLLFSLVRSLSFSLAARVATTSGIFAIVLALWYLFFGPIYTNWIGVCFAIGLTVLRTDDLPVRSASRR